MSARIVDIILSTTLNLALWLVGFIVLYEVALSTQFWMLMALLCALLGGVVGQLAARRLVPSYSDHGRPLTIFLGAVPVVAALGYLLIVRDAADGPVGWLLFILPVIAVLIVALLIQRLRQRRALSEEARLRRAFDELSILKGETFHKFRSEPRANALPETLHPSKFARN